MLQLHCHVATFREIVSCHLLPPWGVMVDKAGMISCINGPDTQHQSLLSWTMH